MQASEIKARRERLQQVVEGCHGKIVHVFPFGRRVVIEAPVVLNPHNHLFSAGFHGATLIAHATEIQPAFRLLSKPSGGFEVVPIAGFEPMRLAVFEVDITKLPQRPKAQRSVAQMTATPREFAR